MQRITFAFVISLFLSSFANADVDKIVHRVIDPSMYPAPPTKAPIGFVVGVITRKGVRKVYSWGTTTLGGDTAPDGDTLFEVASISKTFTATLLAQAVVEGKIALTDPVSDASCDSKTVSSLCYKGTSTTFLDLVTHTAALPDTISEASDLDAFSRADVDHYLSTHKIPRKPGTEYHYSNLGFGYLADLISDREGRTFNQLVEDQISGVLGMTNTKVVLSNGDLAAMNPGYSGSLTALPNFAPERLYDFTDQSGLSGAAAVHSTANDLLNYLSAEMGITQSSLSQAMELSQIQRFTHAPSNSALAVAMGWEILVNQKIIFHSGDLPGFDSFMGYNTETGVGVVVLSNSSLYASRGNSLVYYDQSTDLGVQLLQSGI